MEIVRTYIEKIHVNFDSKLNQHKLRIQLKLPIVHDKYVLNESKSKEKKYKVLNGTNYIEKDVEKSKVAVERGKIAYEQEELNLQRNVYTAFTDAKGALNSYEASLVTLEARQEAFISAKERFEVGLMNAFDYNQSQTLLVNAQSEVLRTKYDYIFKTKILEFYFGIPIIQKP